MVHVCTGGAHLSDTAGSFRQDRLSVCDERRLDRTYLCGYRKELQGSGDKRGMNIRFDEDVLRTSEAEIDAWIQKIAK